MDKIIVNTVLGKPIDDLFAIIDRLQAENKKLLSEKYVMHLEIDTLRDELEKAQDENAKLRAALESLRRGDKEHDNYCAYGDPDGLNFCTCSSRNTNAIIDAALIGGV